MLIPHMKLVSLSGGELHLYRVQPGGEWFTCDAYISLFDAPKGDIFIARDPRGKAVRVRTAQPLHAGLNISPGDPEHFGTLSEQPLFQQLPDGG